jgi:hypothetical protein
MKMTAQTKKKLFVILPVIILIILGAVFLLNKNKAASKVTEPVVTKKKVQSPVNVIPVAERPYLRLEPSRCHTLP